MTSSLPLFPVPPRWFAAGQNYIKQRFPLASRLEIFAIDVVTNPAAFSAQGA
jgi:hypothetical protein